VQPFQFFADEFGALWGLAVRLVLWVGVNYLLRQEVARRAAPRLAAGRVARRRRRPQGALTRSATRAATAPQLVLPPPAAAVAAATRTLGCPRMGAKASSTTPASTGWSSAGSTRAGRQCPCRPLSWAGAGSP
jgi:hypothetical protein